MPLFNCDRTKDTLMDAMGDCREHDVRFSANLETSTATLPALVTVEINLVTSHLISSDSRVGQLNNFNSTN